MAHIKLFSLMFSVTEQDKPLRGQPARDLIKQELITEFRKKFGMTQDDFNMAVTDFDMKLKVNFNAT